MGNSGFVQKIGRVLRDEPPPDGLLERHLERRVDVAAGGVGERRQATIAAASHGDVEGVDLAGLQILEPDVPELRRYVRADVVGALLVGLGCDGGLDDVPDDVIVSFVVQDGRF